MDLPRKSFPSPSAGVAEQENGDPQVLTPRAFEALYRRMWPNIVDYLRFRVGDAEAADIAADVFTRAWSARQQHDPSRGAPSAWLWGIARNAARDWHRAHVVRVGTLPEDLAADDELAARGAQSVAMAQVNAALSTLDGIDQDIIALRFGGGLSHREVGHTLGLSDTAAAQRLHRALGRVREALDREGSA